MALIIIFFLILFTIKPEEKELLKSEEWDSTKKNGVLKKFHQYEHILKPEINYLGQ